MERLKMWMMVAVMFGLGLSACQIDNEPEPNTDTGDAIGLDVGNTELPVVDIHGSEDAGSQDTMPSQDTAPSPPDDTGTPEDTAVAVDGGGSDGTGAVDTVSPTDTQTPEEDVPKSQNEILCEDTGGVWDPESCGHYTCGEPPDCAAIIPGCNCGTGKVFDGGQGCIAWDGCEELVDKPTLCVETGGEWLELTCGDWFCGEAPTCKAIIPGCNCGEGRVYDNSQGCIPSDECNKPDGKEGLCLDTGGEWKPNSCGDWVCGQAPICLALMPGCNCGEGKNFDPVKGCIEDPKCGDPNPGAKDACEDTGGKWLTNTCGNWVCGEAPTCKAIIPGCNCGKGKKFNGLKGCYEDPICDDIGPGAQDVCKDTGGKWLVDTCGHWECGEEPQCKAIKPGCNCGLGKNFNPLKGCHEDPQCNIVKPDKKAKLCLDTGGKWLPTTCGDWKCGNEPLCEAIIPGCNCGNKNIFNLDKGCVADPSCGPIGLGKNDPQTLCMDTDGDWDLFCGEPSCGVVPEMNCANPKPACNCGEGKVLIKESGCIASLYCEGETTNEGLCLGTGGEWLPDSCGNWTCGQKPGCNMVKPGCNCGLDSYFFPKYGCNEAEICL
jgi:hypothetical protein